MSDLYRAPDPEPPICGRCGSTNLEPVTPPQGDPHRRWLCECGTNTTGSKAERARHLAAELVAAAERDDAASALARHREETER